MTCRRCRKETDQNERFCNNCYYPGIEETYDEYQALLEEGHRPIQAAVMSGWQDPDEAGAYCEED
ncbi:hypothetical protein CAG63_18360 [Vibrio sp. V37_P2S8PM304]|uniref:hypothetical protein n=1 Tax=Vibrio sp. V37_P2S8PM304 TaxID=1938688 RepID=UPI0013731D0E|nr:hypothetical protein [Vibrio sp. V37_P2S8PM304]NAX32011.1 hypothetical protein [Vibrio sp. V37_P2S8PM304]